MGHDQILEKNIDDSQITRDQFNTLDYFYERQNLPGQVARLPPEQEAPSSIPGPATYFRFPFR